jgi:hypothetical protein
VSDSYIFFFFFLCSYHLIFLHFISFLSLLSQSRRAHSHASSHRRRAFIGVGRGPAEQCDRCHLCRASWVQELHRLEGLLFIGGHTPHDAQSVDTQYFHFGGRTNSRKEPIKATRRRERLRVLSFIFWGELLLTNIPHLCSQIMMPFFHFPDELFSLQVFFCSVELVFHFRI